MNKKQIEILKKAYEFEKSKKQDKITLFTLQNSLSISDDIFVKEVLELERNNYLDILPKNDNWSQIYTERKEALHFKLKNNAYELLKNKK